jgi:hypothetical protein
MRKEMSILYDLVTVNWPFTAKPHIPFPNHVFRTKTRLVVELPYPPATTLFGNVRVMNEDKLRRCLHTATKKHVLRFHIGEVRGSPSLEGAIVKVSLHGPFSWANGTLWVNIVKSYLFEVFNVYMGTIGGHGMGKATLRLKDGILASRYGLRASS